MARLRACGATLNKPVLITMGEPGGIGPEVAIKGALAAAGSCDPVLVGDPGVFTDTARALGVGEKVLTIQSPSEYQRGKLCVISSGEGASYSTGRPTPGGGRASVQAIKMAAEIALGGGAAALVTAPISKEALRMAGEPWPGHTEMLAELSGTVDYAMMLMGGPLRVILVTIHRELSAVPALITRDSVLRTIKLARRACGMLSIASPRIAVAGLNPHAGEGGMFGSEEAVAIGPAVADALRNGMEVSGPHPPDTVYSRASRGEFDIVVSMYHDQGLIPIKLLAFTSGVNVTVGLPYVRTSPDHGTAYDIAGRGKADPESMVEAIRAALRLKPA